MSPTLITVVAVILLLLIAVLFVTAGSLLERVEELEQQMREINPKRTGNGQ